MADTREQVAALNAAIRDRLVGAGRVDDTRTVTTTAGERLGVGDRVATRRNDRDLGVANRDTWTITGIGDDGTLTVSGTGIGPDRGCCPPAMSPSTSSWPTPPPSTAPRARPPTPGICCSVSTPPARRPTSAMTRGREHNVAHLVAEDLDQARAQWDAVFAPGPGRPRPRPRRRQGGRGRRTLRTAPAAGRGAAAAAGRLEHRSRTCASGSATPSSGATIWPPRRARRPTRGRQLDQRDRRTHRTGSTPPPAGRAPDSANPPSAPSRPPGSRPSTPTGSRSAAETSKRRDKPPGWPPTARRPLARRPSRTTPGHGTAAPAWGSETPRPSRCPRAGAQCAYTEQPSADAQGEAP